MFKRLAQFVALPGGRSLVAPQAAPRRPAFAAVTTTILKGAAGSLLVKLLTVVTAFAAQYVLARMLGAEQFGIFVFVLACVGIGIQVATLGFNTSLVRFLPEYRTTGQWSLFRGVLQRAHGAVAMAGLAIAGVAAAIVGVAFHDMPAGTAIALLVGAASLPLAALVCVSQAGLQGLKQVVRSQLPYPIVRPFVLAGTVAVLGLSFGYSCTAAEALGINAAGLLVALVLASVWLRRSMPVESFVAPASYQTRHWLRTSMPMFMVSGMRELLKETDIILIGVLLGTTQAGIYAVASRLAQLMTFGLTAGNSIAAPVISELFAARHIRQLQHATLLTCLIATSVALAIGGVLLAAPTQIIGLFGNEFQAAATVLLILAVGQLINAATGPVGYLLNMTGHQNTNAKIFGIVTLLNVVLNYPAIRLWGIEGAAIVTSSMIALKNIWTWLEVRRRLGVNSSIMSLRGWSKP